MKTKMKKGVIATFLMILMISPFMFLWLSHADWQPSSSAIDDLIYIGKTQIAQKSTIGVQSAHQTFQLAYDTKYTQASDLQKIKIAMYLSLTRLMDFAVRQEGASTETLATFLAKYGVSYTGTNQEDLKVIFPIDDAKKVNLPANAPPGEALRAFLAGPLMNTLTASLADMDKVIGLLGPTPSKEIISKTLINPDDPNQPDVEIDDGDYYLYRAGLKAAKAFALTMSSYDMNISFTEVAGLIYSNQLNLKELLERYPQLLTILTTGGNPSYAGAAKLGEARALLVSAIADYMIASEKIRNDHDTTPGAQELLSILTEDDLAQELKFRNHLSQLNYSLTDASHPAGVFNLDDGSQFTLNLNPLFGNGSGPVSPRSMLPQFTEFGWGNPVSGTMGHGLGNDPTLGGILPTFTQDNWSEYLDKALTPTGTVTIPTKTITVDGLTPDWAGVAPFMEPKGLVEGTYDAGMDIDKVFMAKDANNYYFRMDTVGPRTNPAQTYDYILEFKQTPGGASSLPGDKSVVARYTPVDVWTITTVGGTVIEFHMQGKNDWGSYKSGSYVVKTAGTDNPALPSSGQSQPGWWAGSLQNGNLNININSSVNQLRVWGPVSGSTLTSGTVQYYNGSNYYNYNTSSGSYVTTTKWATYLAVCNVVNGYLGWTQQYLGDNMAMGLDKTVEWKAGLAVLGNISGYFIKASAKPLNNYGYSWWGETSYTTQQVGPTSAMGKASGNLTIPGYDGTGNIYIGVYSSARGYQPGEALAFKTIYPGGYTPGMAFSFNQLPAGVNVFIAIHWDRDGNSMMNEGDYTSSSASFTTSSTLAVPVIPAPTAYTPYPAPVVEFADVSRITEGGVTTKNWLRAIVLGPSPENVNVTVKTPLGMVYQLTPVFFQKQLHGQLYAYSLNHDPMNQWQFPYGEYTFEAVDSMGRKAVSVKKIFASNPNPAMPVPGVMNLWVNGNPAAGNGAFYTNADPSTTPIALSWGSVGAGYLYDVEVYDLYGRVVFFMTAPNSLSATAVNIPAGTLQPETPYLVYVKTSDPTRPGYASITTAKTIYTGTQLAPAFSFANIVFANTPFEHPPFPGNNYGIQAAFRIPGVLPSEIVSLSIKNGSGAVVQTFNYNPATIYRFDQNGYYAYNTLAPQQLPDDGNYRFEATIRRGGEDTVIVSNPFAFTYSNVPAVDYLTLLPANDSYSKTTTPTFNWNGVAGTYYRLQVFDTNGNVEVYSSAWDTGKTSYSAAVAAGKLLRGGSYYWTVQSSNTNTDLPNVVNYAVGNKKFFYKDMNRFTVLPDADLKAAVSGLVMNENSQIQPGALVEVLQNNVLVASTTANINGQYGFNLAKNQNYTIRVTVPGYAPKTLDVSLGGTDLSNRNIAFAAGDIDNTAPVISNLTPAVGGYAATSPEISAIIQNSGVSGIDPASINLYVDRNRVAHTYNPATGKVSFMPPAPLAYDAHTVVLDVKNYAGKSALASWHFIVFADSTPDQFVFNDQTGVELSTVITSNIITVSGITVASPISITGGGTYSINGGAYTNVASNVINGDTITVRQTSSSSYSTKTDATLTIGGVSDTFSVTTKAQTAQGALYAAFNNYGLYKYEGNYWRPINYLNPDSMTASGGILYADFKYHGLYKFDGNRWYWINYIHPQKMLSTDGKLYAAFDGYGFYQYDGANWRRINYLNPDVMIASNGILYADFKNYGLYKFDGNNWIGINGIHPSQMLSTDGKLYATFEGYGFYKYEGNYWRRINSVNPDSMTESGGVLYAAFKYFGLFKFDGNNWIRVNGILPSKMLSTDRKLYAAFDGYGFYKYDGINWIRINSVNPDSITVSDGILYATFDRYGFFKYDGTNWTQINSIIPAKVVAGE